MKIVKIATQEHDYLILLVLGLLERIYSIHADENPGDCNAISVKDER